MQTRKLLSFVLAAGLAFAASAEPAKKTDLKSLLKYYELEGGKNFSAERGEAFWLKFHDSEDGVPMNCASCHGTDLKQAGKHNKSGKVIEPMANSVNPQRYTEFGHVAKWFSRNCKQVLRRECTAQEKGDVLLYLSQF